MDFQTAVKTVEKLEQFLIGRNWCIDGDLTGILDQAQREIERVQETAIRGIVGKLERYRQEASTWAANEMTDLEGNTERISKREQQKSRTDAKRIRAVIVKIGTVE